MIIPSVVILPTLRCLLFLFIFSFYNYIHDPVHIPCLMRVFPVVGAGKIADGIFRNEAALRTQALSTSFNLPNRVALDLTAQVPCSGVPNRVHARTALAMW